MAGFGCVAWCRGMVGVVPWSEEQPLDAGTIAPRILRETTPVTRKRALGDEDERGGVHRLVACSAWAIAFFDDK